MNDNSSPIGIIIIGRDEGDRLKACIHSLGSVPVVVYVDSGSSDDSVEFARNSGARVIELQVPPKFTAGRARNAGLAELIRIAPDTEMVQMVDGDCTLTPGWISAAKLALDQEPSLAAVFGRVRELHPNASIFNALCDEEWNVPVGLARSCGGNAMFRTAALAETDGYDPTLIAGEEPDLCLRMRERGWGIRRIDHEMALHDAAIHKVRQWWVRTKRSGHAYAALLHRHGRHGDPLWSKQCISILFWSGMLPFAAISGLMIFFFINAYYGSFLFSISVFAWVFQFLRVTRYMKGRNLPFMIASSNALLIMVGKFAEISGLFLYVRNYLLRKSASLIEYRKL